MQVQFIIFVKFVCG